MEGKEKRKTPPGVLILGGLNCFVFGLLFLSISISNYFRITPEEFGKILEIFKTSGLGIQITYQDFKAYNVIPVIISFIFLLSGAGILLKKEWARKLTVYFAFAAIIAIFLTVLMQSFLIRLVIIHAAYLGALIIYFTNKNVEGYFQEEK